MGDRTHCARHRTRTRIQQSLPRYDRSHRLDRAALPIFFGWSLQDLRHLHEPFRMGRAGRKLRFLRSYLRSDLLHWQGSVRSTLARAHVVSVGLGVVAITDVLGNTLSLGDEPFSLLVERGRSADAAP